MYKFVNKGEGKLYFGNKEIYNYYIFALLIVLAVIIQFNLNAFSANIHAYAFSLLNIICASIIALKSSALIVKGKKYKNKLTIKKLKALKIISEKFTLKEISRFSISVHIKKNVVFYDAYLATPSKTITLFSETQKITQGDIYKLKEGKDLSPPDSIIQLTHFAKELNIDCLLPKINKQTLLPSSNT